mgnify:CR=1 FL=1
MRTIRLQLLLSALVGTTFAVHPALAQGTPEQRAACQSDAFRLCSAHIPDADAIAACLRQNDAKLSKACHTVMFAPTPKLRDTSQTGSHNQ